MLTMRLGCLVLAAVFALSCARTMGADAPASFPPPAKPKEDADLGKGIQRTMSLLATSTPQRRNKVRILFYGQSITEQDWSKQVAADLRRRFPNAVLEIENRAIGGFASQLLIRPAEHDLYPFYPDLLIFHVYGSHTDYEKIIKEVRARTTAEVLMQTDHVAAKWPQETPDEKADKSLWWDWTMNNRFLPEIAKRNGCALVDVRMPWVQYLKDNKLEPRALLKDDVHLNDHGNFLMAALVGRYLVHRPDYANDAATGDVRTLEVGKDLQWRDGRLTVPFEGNRIDVVLGPGKGDLATVLIDGKKPSEFPGCYRITRPQPGPWSALTVTRIDREKPLVLEEWTLTITAVEDAAKRKTFEVIGSTTGPDGSGSSDATFTSQSGRVKIEPAAFFGTGRVRPGYQIKWSVLPMFADTIDSTPAVGEAGDRTVTLAQGMPNEKHTLEIIATGGGQPAITAIRVYRPSGKAE